AADIAKDPWQDIPEYVQVWVEKNALIGVLEPVTDEYDVALMSAVGYSSISFLHKTARQLNDLPFPIYIYQFGDLDPSGAQAAEVIERDLRQFAHLVREVIERHLPRTTLDAINTEGAREKARLGRMLDEYIEGHKPRTWSSFGSEHLDALY